MTSVPRKHHYLPQFYTRGWAGCDGLVERFARPSHGRVVVKRLAPSAVGYQHDLYAAPHLDPNTLDAHRLEWRLFATVDGEAAAVAHKLIQGQIPTTDETRTAWAMFLMSMFHRNPFDYAATKQVLSAIYNQSYSDLQLRYEDIRKPDDPETFEQWERENDPSATARLAHGSFPITFANKSIGQYLINILWAVVDTSGSKLELLTSDNPLIFRPLKESGGHLAIPLSPNRLFVATEFPWVLDQLRHRNPTEITIRCNSITVGNAITSVVAANRSQRSYIEARFGKERLGSLAASFANV